MAHGVDNNSLALTVTSSRHLSEEQKVKLQKATKEFESIFVQMMLKSMRSAQGEESNESGGDSYGNDVMKGMFDTELSKHIGRQGKLGIAESLYKKLTGESLPAPSAQSGVGAATVGAIRAGGRTKSVAASGSHAAGSLGSAEAGPEQAISSAAKKNASGSALKAGVVQQLAVSADTITTKASAALEQADGVTAGKVAMISSVVPVQAKRDASRTDIQVPANVRLTASAALERVKTYNDIIARTASSVGVDANLLKAMIVEESGGKQHARSSRNAKGLMQLIDTTAQSMGVKNVWDPHQNIQGGARYLKQQLEKFNGDVSLALASYNAGPGNVERYKGMPPFQETRNYVKRVMNLFTAFQSLERKSDDVIE